MKQKVYKMTDKQAVKAFPSATVYAHADSMDRTSWLIARRAGIGGSDVANILGIGHYASEYKVWRSKVDTDTPIDQTTMAQKCGNYFEPVLRQMLADDNPDWKVYIVPQMLKSKKHDYMRADLDGAILMPDKTWAGLEIKTTSSFRAKDWDNGVPAYYITQVQHYMAVTGLKKFVVIAQLNTNVIQTYLIERDDALIDVFVNAEEKFWDKVVNNVQPELDGSENTSDMISRKYADGRISEAFEVTGGEADALEVNIRGYQEAAEKLKAAEEEKRAYANRIKDCMKQHERVCCGQYSLSWTMSPTTKLDSKAVKEKYPEVFNECSNTSLRDNGLRLKSFGEEA